MSKNKEELENPFDAFDILKGEFVQPVDDEIESPDDNVITDDVVDDSVEDDNFKKADEELKKIVEKQSKATKPVVEEIETPEETIDEPTTTQTTNGYLDAVKDLYERGVLEVNLEEIEDSEEGFEKAIQKTVDTKIKNSIAKLGDEALSFLAFIENGGNPKDFINTYYKDNSWETYDIETEHSQKVAIRESLKLAGETDEDIEDLISEFEDNGTLEKRAKSAITKLQKFEKEQKAKIVEEQQLKAQQEKEANVKFWNEFKDDLDKKQDIKGFKLTPKLKEDLWKHMTAVDKKTGKTAYQQAIENDRDAQLLFALQSMTKFDISKLEKQVENKVASKVSGILKNYQPSSKDKISSGRTHVDKDGEDPFALFSKI